MIVPLIALAALASAPADEVVRLDVTRDTWMSGVGEEADGSNGGVPRLKLKSIQEFSILDVDIPRVKFADRTIRSATLHLRSTGSPILKRVTVAGLASPFHEGTATGYAKQAGASTFRRVKHPDEPWAGVGDLCNVMFGPRGGLWKTADATAPDQDGWQAVAVDPRVIAARAAGLCGGFVVFDDTGTEWTRDGDKFERTLFPNRFVYSRDQNAASAPYFTVTLGEPDDRSPSPVSGLRVDPETADLPAGEAFISWITPEDQGPSGLLGYRASFDGRPLGMASIPMAGKPGERVRIKLTRGRGSLEIAAVDAAGNESERAILDVRPSAREPKPPLGGGRPGRPKPGTSAPKLDDASISIVDELDKVHPVLGTILPAGRQADGVATPYLLSNHLFDASLPRIRLIAGFNEAVAFQVVVAGEARGLTASLTFDGPSPAEVSIGRYVNVMTKNGPMPDPIVPLAGPIDVPEPGVSFTSLHVELQVAKVAKPGFHHGKLVLASKTDRLELPFEIVLGGYSLPDHLSFLPEMNCYGLPENERDYYRLAHRHRTVLNRVPYGHNGRVHDGCAPEWDGKRLDWAAWDRRFGPLFDGSAFADLPRKSVPIELFYLPLFENWPTPVEGNYDGGYWADRAFSKSHSGAFVEASKQIAEHVRSKGWDDTIFECFFNGKNDFKDRGWSRATSPWLLDEPANFQDYWALRHFGGLFHEGINAAPAGKAKLMFRADISRPQWQRDILDDVLDMNVVGGAVRDYRPMVLERKERLGQVVIEYGSTNPIEASNLQPVTWSIDAWTMGLDGVLPWQTIGTQESWKTADELSLFYPGRDGGPPIPSIRLKAYRRGQQDVELLTLWAKASGEPRWSIARRVRASLSLAWMRRKAMPDAAEDAGRIDYENLNALELDSLRGAVRNEINLLHAKGESRLVEFKTPRREPRAMEDRIARP